MCDIVNTFWKTEARDKNQESRQYLGKRCILSVVSELKLSAQENFITKKKQIIIIYFFSFPIKIRFHYCRYHRYLSSLISTYTSLKIWFNSTVLHSCLLILINCYKKRKKTSLSSG